MTPRGFKMVVHKLIFAYIHCFKLSFWVIPKVNIFNSMIIDITLLVDWVCTIQNFPWEFPGFPLFPGFIRTEYLAASHIPCPQLVLWCRKGLIRTRWDKDLPGSQSVPGDHYSFWFATSAIKLFSPLYVFPQFTIQISFKCLWYDINTFSLI